MSECTFILESKGYDSEALSLYKELGAVYPCKGNPLRWSRNEEVTILVCRLGYDLNASFLGHFPALKCIASPTTGLNHIDLEFCRNRNIEVISLKGETNFLESIYSTSELTFALILALVRNVVPAVDSIRQDHWDRDSFLGRELQDMVLGLLGLGRIGSHVAGYARSFGMEVLACDPFVPDKIFRDLKVKRCSQSLLFEKSDVVSIHADSRPENVGLVTKNDFIRMKQGSYFVNTARGELVNENDLVWALENKILAGAAVDVLASEQNNSSRIENPLIRYFRKQTNLLITPHIGGCTSEAMRKTELFIAKNVRFFFKNNR